MQGLIAVALVFLSYVEDSGLATLVVVGLVIAFAAAMMDLALDALAATSVPAEARAVAGGLKVGALSLGSMVGGGVFVAMRTRPELKI
ncbi:hypothetical protein [Brucella tritici]|uniref:Uncharacterized protein n=1 Tax=Brucella tritici TaxID=94626 RepID=A0A6L3Y5M6_9HYPH|nr:hypothetical protein [Brucella tritici]KAB2676674.1 hypothetical protein F9L08_26180 [Brucella tritici]